MALVVVGAGKPHEWSRVSHELSVVSPDEGGERVAGLTSVGQWMLESPPEAEFGRRKVGTRNLGRGREVVVRGEREKEKRRKGGGGRITT